MPTAAAHSDLESLKEHLHHLKNKRGRALQRLALNLHKNITTLNASTSRLEAALMAIETKTEKVRAHVASMRQEAKDIMAYNSRLRMDIEDIGRNLTSAQEYAQKSLSDGDEKDPALTVLGELKEEEVRRQREAAREFALKHIAPLNLDRPSILADEKAPPSLLQVASSFPDFMHHFRTPSAGSAEATTVAAAAPAQFVAPDAVKESMRQLQAAVAEAEQSQSQAEAKMQAAHDAQYAEGQRHREELLAARNTATKELDGLKTTGRRLATALLRLQKTQRMLEKRRTSLLAFTGRIAAAV